MKEVRTRFAPSPTGYLHVGNIRTGVFAWLVARHAGGKFVLRLEDTDKKREVVGADEHLAKTLAVLGVEWDEGFDKGGQFAPYRQSDRLDHYQKWAQKLIDAGRAYADPYTPEEVQAFREQAQAAKKPFLYRNHRPENPAPWDGSTPLRFKSDPKDYQWQDQVMGELHAGADAIDDFILMKSDGYPTYNFAHIVDDAEMEITHVIRGQEFIASTPNYLNLYEALRIERPILATMPHILGADGKKKLSKRDGAKDVLDYVRDGYLVEALLNFICSMGWNDGTEQEIFSRDELIAKFRLDHVGRSGAKFDEQRLLWMNGHYIRAMSVDALYERISAAGDYWPTAAKNYDEAYQKQVLDLVQERLKFFNELSGLSNFFFEDLPVNSDLITTNKYLKRFDKRELRETLIEAKSSLEQSDFSVESLTNTLNDLLAVTGQKPGELFSLIRIATTQAPASPALADTLAVLGKEVTLRRIDQQVAAF